MEYLFLFMTLFGYWVGIINIEKLWKGTRDSYLPTAEELIVVDDNGTSVQFRIRTIPTYEKVLPFLRTIVQVG